MSTAASLSARRAREIQKKYEKELERRREKEEQEHERLEKERTKQAVLKEQQRLKEKRERCMATVNKRRAKTSVAAQQQRQQQQQVQQRTQQQQSLKDKYKHSSIMISRMVAPTHNTSETTEWMQVMASDRKYVPLSHFIQSGMEGNGMDKKTN